MPPADTDTTPTMEAPPAGIIDDALIDDALIAAAMNGPRTLAAVNAFMTGTPEIQTDTAGIRQAPDATRRTCAIRVWDTRQCEEIQRLLFRLLNIQFSDADMRNGRTGGAYMPNDFGPQGHLVVIAEDTPFLMHGRVDYRSLGTTWRGAPLLEVSRDAATIFLCDNVEDFLRTGIPPAGTRLIDESLGAVEVTTPAPLPGRPAFFHVTGDTPGALRALAERLFAALPTGGPPCSVDTFLGVAGTTLRWTDEADVSFANYDFYHKAQDVDGEWTDHEWFEGEAGLIPFLVHIGARPAEPALPSSRPGPHKTALIRVVSHEQSRAVQDFLRTALNTYWNQADGTTPQDYFDCPVRDYAEEGGIFVALPYEGAHHTTPSWASFGYFAERSADYRTDRAFDGYGHDTPALLRDLAAFYEVSYAAAPAAPPGPPPPMMDAQLDRLLGPTLRTLVESSPSAPTTRGTIRAQLSVVPPPEAMANTAALRAWLREALASQVAPAPRVIPAATPPAAAPAPAPTPAADGISVRVTYSYDEDVRELNTNHRSGRHDWTISRDTLEEIAEEVRAEGGDFDDFVTKVEDWLRDDVIESNPDTDVHDTSYHDSTVENTENEEVRPSNLTGLLRTFIANNPDLDPERDDEEDEEDEE